MNSEFVFIRNTGELRQKAFDYYADGRLKYRGLGVIGAALTDAKWLIEYYTYLASGLIDRIKYSGDGEKFSNRDNVIYG